MKKTLLRSLAALSVSALLLAGCGGGGGGGDASPYGSSSQFSESVAGCSAETQKSFVRAYLDEVYLWYREIVNVDASKYSTPDDYFDALLVRPKDEFSTALFTGRRAALLQSAVSAPQPAPTDLLAAHTNSVPVSTVVTTGGGRRVGYVQLENQDAGSQDDLITAFRQLQADGIQDLVLDLRKNTGGFLYVALTAASMISGPATNGLVFERLVFNDKRGEQTLSYSGQVQFPDGSAPQYPVGTPLPQLSLTRVFVLTSADTCSASESIINGLRGVGVQVIRVGGTTCGKPYGFTERANCGYSYFAIEFQGFNAQGFGDYQDGFTPMCNVADTSTSTTRGTTADPLLSGALYYADNGTCQSGTTGVQSAGAPIVEKKSPRPAGASRLLLPAQQPPH